MYRVPKYTETSIEWNESYEGETIEQKVARILSNNEPIEDGAPIIYTERKDGVRPEYDIRTDRFEIAVEAMDKVNMSKLMKRQESIKTRDEAKVVGMKKDSGAEPIQGTDKQ